MLMCPAKGTVDILYTSFSYFSKNLLAISADELTFNLSYFYREY